MFEWSGYRTVETIASNEEIIIYRLVHLEDSRSVIAKTTRDEHPGPALVATFHYEYDIFTRLHGRGAVEPYSLELVADRPVLLVQDIGGSTLDRVLRERAPAIGLTALLSIAAAVVDCLLHIHREQMTHHEITPSHLMVNPDTLEVKFIDVRMCSTLSHKSSLTKLASRPDSALSYISPEQTGRTGLVPDYRSDFYSLGITLYEWLTGVLPFEQQDALGIVYQHLASTPRPVHVRAPIIPRMVSDIIDKCMAKMPDARYTSAFGIKSDLEVCLTRYRESGVIEPFALGSRDVPDRWIFPSALYGRHAEQQSLLSALQRSTEGAVKMVWVSGNGGIGKTTFIQESLRKARPSGGFSVSGKFDPNHTAIPYDVWVQALEQLIDQLLTKSELQAEVWKLRILHAVDGYGQLLIDLVPKLKLLIDEQPSVQPLPPVEAQRRFHFVLNRFMQLFVDREHPLVLFFDDLQWADEASLHYLAYLLTDRDTKHLLVVGAYREAEITSTHPVRRLEEYLQERNMNDERILLSVLDSNDLLQLLRDAIRSESAETDALASVLLHKTAGNPFFLKQFLQDLVNRGLVTFNDSNRCWQWNLRLIAEMNIPDSAAAYISDRMNHLPVQIRYVLSCAACLGNRFELGTLGSLTGLSELELLEALGTAEHERMLQRDTSDNAVYKFQHDRIRQVAYALVPEAERPDLHLRIGRLLAQRVQTGGDVNVFEVVNHLNQGLERIEHRGQKLELAELNIQAGMKAKQSNAYETSLGYYRNATSLLPEDGWDSNYSLAFRSYKERAELEYLCTHFDKADVLFNLLLQRSRTNLDKALVYSVMIQFESNKDNYRDVMALAEKALGLLNIRHNFKPSSHELTLQWMRLLWKLRRRSVGSLHDLPPMTDESRKVAMMVLVYMGNASFNLDKKVWAANFFTMIDLTLDYGITPESSIGFVGYAMILYFQFRQDRSAYEWGTLACQVSVGYPALYVKTLTAFSLCYDSWRQYDTGFLERFTDQAGKLGLESGDLWQSNHSVILNCVLLLQFGHPLGDIYDRLIAHSSSLQRNNNNLQWKQASIFADLLARLTGYRSADDPFDKTDLYKEGYVRSVHGDDTNYMEGLVCICLYMTGYLFGRFKEAHHYIKKEAMLNASEGRKDDIIGEKSTPYMYETLVLSELYEEEGERERKAIIARIRGHEKKMKQYAKRCPENYEHKYLMVQAVLASLEHHDREAEDLYEQCIADARKHGHIHNVGIVAERLAKHGLNRGKNQLAKIYMTEAYEAYMQWGAVAKAADLAAKYGHLLNLKSEHGRDRVDYLSVIMSAQALSGEMEMPRLLNALMRIMLQNAGAESGALLFNYDDSWVVETHGKAEELIIESIPLEDAADFVPSAIIGYAARTQEEVVLHNAAGEGMFTRIPYVKENRLKSVLCLPILHQDKLICLLYMENKLSSGLFTPDRLDVLKLLCSQCAISIYNARLYTGIRDMRASLEQQVEERTRSLERSMRETAAALAEMSLYEERNRIAQEIHDVVGHTLTSTILQVEAGKRLLHKDKEGAVVRLEEAQDLVRHGLNEIRRSVHMLKEGQSFDLGHTLHRLIRDTERNTGVSVNVSIHDLPEMSTSHQKAIYHALQEGLTNGIRHGESTEFHFNLEYNGTTLLFRLEDNGKGTGVIVMGFGLKSMKERVEQLGGRLRISSNTDQGCQLRIDIPYPMQTGGGT